MEIKNFEAFNRIALYLLIKLFESFPKNVDIDANSLGCEAKSKDKDETYEEIWESMEFALYTITWLQKEGFIDIEHQCYGGKFLGCRLTLKGLTLLGYTPLKGGKKYHNLAEKAKAALAEGARDVVTEVAKELFIGALKYIPEAFNT